MVIGGLSLTWELFRLGEPTVAINIKKLELREMDNKYFLILDKLSEYKLDVD